MAKRKQQKKQELKSHVTMVYNTAIGRRKEPVAKTLLSTYFKSSEANFVREPGAGFGASCVVEFDTDLDLVIEDNMIVEDLGFGIPDVAGDLDINDIAEEIDGFDIPYDETFLVPRACAMRGRNPDNPNLRKSGLPTLQRLEIGTDIANCLTTVGKDSMIIEPVVVRRPHGYSKGGVYDICPPITASYFHENNFLVEGDDGGE